MKKSLKVFLVISAVSLLFFTACDDDNGFDPFGDPVEKFLGEWQCEESSTVYGDGYNFQVIITRNPDNSAEILMANFYHQGFDVKARALVVGNNLTIPRQGICDDTIEIQGSGTYKNGEVNMAYTANDGADIDEVTARLYKP